MMKVTNNNNIVEKEWVLIGQGLTDGTYKILGDQNVEGSDFFKKSVVYAASWRSIQHSSV